MCGRPTDGSLVEAGGASFVNFVKIEDFGGLSVGTYMPIEYWDFEESLNLVVEVNDGQLVAHFLRQEYDILVLAPESLRRVYCLMLCDPL